MSPKKKVNKSETQKTEKIIQVVAVVMIVIVVVIIAWPYAANLFSTTDAGSTAVVEDVGSETACAVFDSIAAA